MPIYEFICTKCKLEFEKYFVSDGKTTGYDKSELELNIPCEHCKGKITKKVSSGTGIKLVGSGFHKNDY